MDANDSARIRLLVEGSEDEILEKIGKFNPDTIYALPQDRAQLIAAGREWFEKRSVQIRDFVCPKATELSKALSEDYINFVFAYLSAENGKALALFLTALVVKKTLDGWCSTANRSENLS
jgi:hypothetical protein